MPNRGHSGKIKYVGKVHGTILALSLLASESSIPFYPLRDRGLNGQISIIQSVNGGGV
jgi:hypothetical protein